MKKLIGLAIFIGLIVLLYSTCPEKKDHNEALSDSVSAAEQFKQGYG